MQANFYTQLSSSFDRNAIAFETPDGTSVTYGEVDRASARAANALEGLGLEPGDRVSVIAQKSLTYLWIYLGCLRGGFIFHPLNPGYTARELEFFFSNAGTRVLIYDPTLADTVISASANISSIKRRIELTATGGGEFEELCRTGTETYNDRACDFDVTAALLYSSGTTGQPKGIRITHGALAANAATLADAWGFSAEDVLVHALPVFHVHGLFIVLGPALMRGTRIRFLASFDTKTVIEQLKGATMMAGVPTYYGRLLNEASFGAVDCTSVRVFISGSAPLSEAAFREFEARTGHAILERYGMTETGINTSNPLNGERKPGSVGPALPDVELRIVNDQLVPVPTGEVGDIQVRGANVFPGYWNLPEADSKAFVDGGWFDTGDQGYLDEDGYVFIVGRSKDLIISGGLNVYPKEVEREIEKIDGIAEAAVFGVPHDDFGEAVVAAVLVRSGQQLAEAGAIRTLKDVLAAFKVPKKLLVLNELPRNSMGKVQKNVLRETYRALFVQA